MYLLFLLEIMLLVVFLGVRLVFFRVYGMYGLFCFLLVMVCMGGYGVSLLMICSRGIGQDFSYFRFLF